MSRKVETKLLYGYRITTKKDEDSTIRQFNGHAERELVVPFFPPFISSFFIFFLETSVASVLQSEPDL